MYYIYKPCVLNPRIYNFTCRDGIRHMLSRMQNQTSEGYCKLPVVAFGERTGFWLGAKWFESGLIFLFNMQSELLHTYMTVPVMTPF